MGRSPREKNGLKKGPWTAEEDKLLIDYIQKHGHGRWRTLPINAGLKRCGKSCRLRWINYLRPDIKRGKFSPEEEQTIIHLHGAWGNKWSAIAASLPGRTDNEIKNYWNTHIKKKLMRMGIDPITHTPRLELLNLYSILSSSLYHNNSNTPYTNLPNLHSIESMEPTQNFHEQQATLSYNSHVVNNPQILLPPNFQDYHMHSSQFTSPMSSPFLGHEMNQLVEANVEKTLLACPDYTITATQEGNLTNTWKIHNETQVLGDNYHEGEKYYNCQYITNANLMPDDQAFQTDCTVVHGVGTGSSLSSSPRSSLAGFDSASTTHGWSNKSSGFLMHDDIRDSLASRIVQF